MNVLTISLIPSCNRSCYYCPNRKWLAPVEEWQAWEHPLNNAALLKWLDAYLNPEEWFVELTGGEPGLYPEIDALIPALAGRGYYGMVKTNGSLPVPASPSFIRVTAWHEGVEKIPRSYDSIVIIENPKDRWKDKAAFCKSRGIPYHTVLFDRQFEGRKIDPAYCRINKTINCLHINSSGQITPCSRATVDKSRTVFNMSPPAPLPLAAVCPRCKNINDVELFLTEDIKKKFEEDFEGLGICGILKLQEKTSKNTLKQG